MRHKGFVAFCLTLVTASVYLFVTAPEPLAQKSSAAGAAIPIARLFDAVDGINAKAREIYTREIVGAGKKVGLAFDENWRDEDVRAGPLPALFLRSTAAALERDPAEIGLFLGSDFPINPSNQFSPEQLALFGQLKTDHRPQYGRVEEDGTAFAMYADLASAEACVTCHNEHADTPKSDWRLNDVMGATTWTYPRAAVTAEEYIGVIAALYRAIDDTYRLYLAEVESLDAGPEIGAGWPRDGFFLPSGDVFLAALRDATAPTVLAAMTRDVTPAD